MEERPTELLRGLCTLGPTLACEPDKWRTWRHSNPRHAVPKVGTSSSRALVHIYAALAYYDHREGIDRSIREDEEFIAELRRRTPSILREKLGPYRRHCDERSGEA